MHIFMHLPAIQFQLTQTLHSWNKRNDWKAKKPDWRGTKTTTDVLVRITFSISIRVEKWVSVKTILHAHLMKTEIKIQTNCWVNEWTLNRKTKRTQVSNFGSVCMRLFYYWLMFKRSKWSCFNISQRWKISVSNIIIIISSLLLSPLLTQNQ